MLLRNQRAVPSQTQVRQLSDARQFIGSDSQSEQNGILLGLRDSVVAFGGEERNTMGGMFLPNLHLVGAREVRCRPGRACISMPDLEEPCLADVG